MIKPSLLKIYNASAGSGKTYTLVKEYLTLVLSSGNPHRFSKILAITFTNKAANEMRERILKNLYMFSHTDPSNENNRLFDDLCKEINLSSKQLIERSKKVLLHILHQYSNFSVSTIDRFTHHLIRSFSHDLGLSSNFEIELHAEKLLSESVEAVLSKLKSHSKITSSLINYTLSKIKQEKSQHIERELTQTAKILLKESDQDYLNKIKTHAIGDFIRLRKKLTGEQKQIVEKMHRFAQRFNEILEENDITEKTFSYRALPNYFKKFGATNMTAISLGKRLEDQRTEQIFYPKSVNIDDQLKMDNLFSVFDDLIEESVCFYEENIGIYTLNSLILKQIPLWSVLNEIEKELSRLKQENNVLFINEFNKIISDEIKNQPVPYIYERIGEKFHYYFIDEFQDTSVLQWNNLRPLIENQLSQSGSALIVGDPKQSIYRWRGSDPEQFINLSENGMQLSFEVKNLETNYRSFQQIVSFNNSFYHNAAQSFENALYKELYKTTGIQKVKHKQTGFIEIYLTEKKREINYNEIQLEYILKTIKDLKKEGFKYEQITVLVRNNIHGISIAQHLSTYDIPIISKESLLLNNASEIQLLVCLLRVLNTEEDYKNRVDFILKLHQNKPSDFQEDLPQFIQQTAGLPLDLFFKKLEQINIFFDPSFALTHSLYGLVEYCSMQLGIDKKKNNGYLQYFLDFALECAIKKTNNLNDFLIDWDEKKSKESIITPTGIDAVQIMTIHKSKGLQFPVVILPYADWNAFNDAKAHLWMPLDKNKYEGFEHFYLPANKHLMKTDRLKEEIIQKNNDQIQLDNLNILYVATTRAIERLYISTLYQKETSKSSIAFYFNDYLDKQGIEKSAWFLHQMGEKKLTAHKKEKMSVFPIVYHSKAWQKLIELSKTATDFWDLEKNSAIEYGKKIHYILSVIRYESEVEKTLNYLLITGYINEQEFGPIKGIIMQIANSDYLKVYYSERYTIFNERELHFEQQILRPDRVAIKGKEAIIIDYKTGAAENQHNLQVNRYAEALQAMGYRVKQKMLVYIRQKINIVTLN